MEIMDQPSSGSMTRWQHVLLILGIIFVSLNLRPAITSLSPLAERLNAEGISREVIGLLSTVPLILFGVAGLWAGWIGGRLGLARALGWGLFVLAVGCFLRSFAGMEAPFWLWTGTAMIGAGIAMGNVLMPSLVKSRYPDQVGLLTSIYSTALNFGAAIGIAVSVPIADFSQGSWRISLSTWGLLSLFSLVIWIPQLKKAPTKRAFSTPFSGIKILSKKARAWQVAFFMGIQSTIFYSSMMWLPTVLQWRGMSEGGAATWATSLQILGCGASLLIPTLAARSRSQSFWIVLCGVFAVVGLIGILWFPLAWVGIGALLLGFGLNSSFGLALLIIAMRSKNHETAAALSSMAQALGYLIAAPGPWFVGFLSQTSGMWFAAYGFVLVLSVINVGVGGLAGREGEMDLNDS